MQLFFFICILTRMRKHITIARSSEVKNRKFLSSHMLPLYATWSIASFFADSSDSFPMSIDFRWSMAGVAATGWSEWWNGGDASITLHLGYSGSQTRTFCYQKPRYVEALRSVRNEHEGITRHEINWKCRQYTSSQCSVTRSWWVNGSNIYIHFVHKPYVFSNSHLFQVNSHLSDKSSAISRWSEDWASCEKGSRLLFRNFMVLCRSDSLSKICRPIRFKKLNDSKVKNIRFRANEFTDLRWFTKLSS